jgi:hypothetical protein
MLRDGGGSATKINEFYPNSPLSDAAVPASQVGEGKNICRPKQLFEFRRLVLRNNHSWCRVFRMRVPRTQCIN